MSNINRWKRHIKTTRWVTLSGSSNKQMFEVVHNKFTFAYLSYIKDISIEHIFSSMCATGIVDKIKMILIINNYHPFLAIDIHANAEDPFRTACEQGHLDVVKLLVQFGIDHDNPVNIHRLHDDGFHVACMYGHFGIVKYLLNYDNSIDINRYYDGIRVISYICQYNYIDLFEYLIKYGVEHNNPLDIHYDAENNFRVTCGKGHFDMIKHMIQLGIDTNNPIDIHALYDASFNFACRSGNIDIIKYLVEIGIEQNKPIDIRNRDDSSFKEVCADRSLNISQYLVSLCPDIYSIEIYDDGTIIPKIEL